MPTMSALEGAFCRSAPWRLAAGRVVLWATQGVSFTGDVLEIGGGSGATADRLARANPSLRLTTTDYDPVMVGVARKRLAKYPHVAARQADVTQLPFDDETFDFVVSFLMLHHVVDWEKAIAEVARVLRPGGIFTGYDLTASRAASWVHLTDRSPHRLIERGAFEPVLGQFRLDANGLRYTFGGRVMRFTARKLALST
ncbi:class I SAM-dependent methyltransferase [Cryobacterium sp. TMT2-4]|uniref:class I SAM-dependent methyltransferase n=1 Tax=Cryobacterium sp. TMT2-4 TaxID=1259254 RepID=UPI00106D9B67|nr:class I SAM-dependent methyltransferase [Cryobacterium sp. TMT2-4]TFC63835.1 class I SAM-dependent methyltransferase [Cryobacterium sp. TMT2-4]